MIQSEMKLGLELYFRLFLILESATCYFPSQAQTVSNDTISLSINEIEGLFFKNNLEIIAQRYNINYAEAQIITAKLFLNPQFSVSNGLYNTDNNRFLDVSKVTGEQSASLSQEFYTAGRRLKGIEVAKSGVQLAKYQFLDMVRSLKFGLRSNFYNVYFQQESAKVYNFEIKSLTDILTAYKTQYAEGNIAQKELLRIQSQLYSLKAELANLQIGIDTTQTRLKILTRISPNAYISPRYKYDIAEKETVTKVPYQQLLDSSYTNRFDLRYAQGAVNYNRLNLELQKALAVPDLTVSLSYDKFGSYIRDYNSIGIGLPLPIFNRNQGVIKQARIAIAQSDALLESSLQRVENSIAISYKTALKYESVYDTFDPDFRDNYNHLIQEVSKNYAKKNISLLSFLDFYESYRTNSLLLNNIELNQVVSLEQLNLVTGTPFFNQK